MKEILFKTTKMTINSSLAKSIDLNCEYLFQKLKSDRKRLSKESVHEIRILSRKLQVSMEILNTLGIHRKNLTKKLHHIRKIFGPLRNIHIELEAIKNFENQNDVHLRPFRKYLERREKNVMKKLLRELEEISVSKQELEFKKLVRKLIDNDTPQTNDKALIKIEDIHRIAYTEFKNKLQALSPNSKKSIHAVRIAAKKLRYQFEILKPAMNLKEINLQKLRLIQDKYGEIQNNFVLQNSIKKYLHKYCPKGCISVLKLQTSVAQEYLIHIAYVRKMKKHSA